MTRTQADRIRQKTNDFLRNPNLITSIQGTNLKGIRYSNLKEILLTSNDQSFSEGAVVGALNTITDRMENIYKIKVPTGTFFYYSEEKIIKTESVDIIESDDFLLLSSKTEELYTLATKILQNANNEVYELPRDIDIKYLRRILSEINSLDNEIKNYIQEKRFYNISRIDDLPF